MNKEYIYGDGKAIIIDEKGAKNAIDYTDNLEDILIEENIIEELTNRKENIINSIKKIGNIKKQSLKKCVLKAFFTSLVSCAIAILFTSLVWNGMDFDYLEMLNSMFRVYNTMFTNISLLACLFVFLDYKDKNNRYKEKRSLEVELEGVSKNLEEANKKLIFLREKKTNNIQKENFTTYRIDDSKKLKILRDLLKLYKKLGYDEDKYLEYYQNGKLEEVLGNYSKEIIDNIENYFDNKQAKGLIKTKNDKKLV